ncbi:glucose/arabinose dehydrogenase [Marmoricola sp. OAE513]|uniref:PQQ-dependent sugar dehydrogenase n=1 Tax=Marmoricola sp. OAE513 TaxID=2817894 RepID=UPI001AE2BA31
MRRLGLLAVTSALVATFLAPSSAPAAAPEKQRATKVPALQVTNAVTGLDIPWDVKNLPGGRLLIGERETAKLIVTHNGSKKVLSFPSSKVWTEGETGLMGLAVDPSFSKNRRIYTCQGGFKKGGGHDVRVVAWKMNSSYTGVSYQKVLVSGFPTTSGRHGGCRLLIAQNGAMIVGTGDAAVGTNPQNKRSFGGKTLRLDRFSGKPWPKNKWVRSKYKAKRYLYTYGHRNVQGLSQRSDGTIWSVEQGTDRNDEVNKLVKGGNYGWNPVPGYNESRPMTDFGLKGKQRGAKWSSGNPTLATSGGSWVYGKQWGDLNGTLAVAALKANRVVFMKFDKAGKLLWTRTPDALRHSGRLRSVTQAANGDLLITTSNNDSDAVIRVHPKL